jgi:hypothetical protein
VCIIYLAPAQKKLKVLCKGKFMKGCGFGGEFNAHSNEL